MKNKSKARFTKIRYDHAFDAFNWSIYKQEDIHKAKLDATIPEISSSISVITRDSLDKTNPSNYKTN